TARELGLGVENGVPLGGLLKAFQQLGRSLTEQIYERGVELRPAMPADDRPRRVGTAPTAEHFNWSGQLHQPRWQADRRTTHMKGVAFAVPLLVTLPNRNAHLVGQTDPFGELRGQRGVRRRERQDLA